LHWISRETLAFIDKLFRFAYSDKGINGVLKNSRFFGSGLNSGGTIREGSDSLRAVITISIAVGSDHHAANVILNVAKNVAGG
jgi:hypothetical protein